MLVEVCGLNPMALDKGMPKAGLRADNLSKQLQALLDAGLEVVSGRSPKQRLLTPDHQPQLCLALMSQMPFHG